MTIGGDVSDAAGVDGAVGAGGDVLLHTHIEGDIAAHLRRDDDPVHRTPAAAAEVRRAASIRPEFAVTAEAGRMTVEFRTPGDDVRTLEGDNGARQSVLRRRGRSRLKMAGCCSTPAPSPDCIRSTRWVYSEAGEAPTCRAFGPWTTASRQAYRGRHRQDRNHL